ncbi:hypothetical protein [Paenibacillus sp.]|uniref:hypothetical protein n=1 Tax=Paenibacillus sp. TaxID=58172 RepID=UPI00281201EF|nr:hypothetical protein [Paenibacillus sp.]
MEEPFRLRRRPFAAMLAASIAALVLVPGAADAESKTETFALHAFTHPKTGESFFNVFLHRPGGETVDRRVIFKTPNGEWKRLPEAVHGTGAVYGGNAYVWVNDPTSPAFDGIYYDAATDELVAGELYETSPNGKFGLRYVMYYELAPAERGYAPGYWQSKRIAVFAKNKQNGVLRQIAVEREWPNLRWLPDGTLLQQRYSEQEKQNEVVRIDPDTGIAERIALASLRAYDEELGLMLYAYNEPERKLYIYDFHEGTSRPARAGEKEELFRIEHAESSPERPEAPADLDVDALPVAETGFRRNDEAMLRIDGQDVPLPYAYFGVDRKLYLPIRPIADAFGWGIERNGAKPEYEYTISTKDGGSIVVDRANSSILNFRLFVDAADIRALYGDLTIDWIAPKR